MGNPTEVKVKRDWLGLSLTVIPSVLMLIGSWNLVKTDVALIANDVKHMSATINEVKEDFKNYRDKHEHKTSSAGSQLRPATGDISKAR